MVSSLPLLSCELSVSVKENSDRKKGPLIGYGVWCYHEETLPFLIGVYSVSKYKYKE